MSAQPLVIYHKNCPSKDGFGSAFAAWLKFGDTAIYHPSDYGDVPPDATGKDVYILDLSFPEDVLTEMSRQAASLTLLDHHETAQRKLSGFKPLCCGKIHFDLTRCGAVLAWEYFHPGKPLPTLFRWIQTRDLWLWDKPGAEPHAKEFLAWLDVQPTTFERWSQIFAMSEDELAGKVKDGVALAQQFDFLCESIARSSAPVTIAGYQGLMVNCSGEFRSQVGSLLAAKSGTFGLVWRVAENGSVLCSLRSLEAFNVEVIAAKFGSGGHPTSASFQLTAAALPELVAGNIPAPAEAPTQG